VTRAPSRSSRGCWSRTALIRAACRRAGGLISSAGGRGGLGTSDEQLFGGSRPEGAEGTTDGDAARDDVHVLLTAESRE